MKKYIADQLTLSRVILGCVVLVSLVKGMWLTANVMLLVGALTDALDGEAARRWPFPASEQHWWRKKPEMNDLVADGVLVFGTLIGLAIASPIWWILDGAIVLGTIVFLYVITYFQTRDPKLAGQIALLHRWSSFAVYAVIFVYMAPKATGHWWPLALVVYAFFAAFLLYFKWDRAKSASPTMITHS